MKEFVDRTGKRPHYDRGFTVRREIDMHEVKARAKRHVQNRRHKKLPTQELQEIYDEHGRLAYIWNELKQAEHSLEKEYFIKAGLAWEAYTKMFHEFETGEKIKYN